MEESPADLNAKKLRPLTRELFEAAGIEVRDRPPRTNPESELVRNQLTPKDEKVRLGVEAMQRLSSGNSRDWSDWLIVLDALAIGRHTAMVESGANAPKGNKYCQAYARWLRDHPTFQVINKGDRSRMFECNDNLPAIEVWRARLSPAQRHKWNYPPIVLREWKKSQGATVSKKGGPKPKKTFPEPDAESGVCITVEDVLAWLKQASTKDKEQICQALFLETNTIPALLRMLPANIGNKLINHIRDQMLDSVKERHPHKRVKRLSKDDVVVKVNFAHPLKSSDSPAPTQNSHVTAWEPDEFAR